MSSDFLLIYGKTWHSIYNALKRTEMNLQEAAVWMPQTGSPSLVRWRRVRTPARGRLVWGCASLFCQEDPGPSWHVTGWDPVGQRVMDGRIRSQ